MGKKNHPSLGQIRIGQSSTGDNGYEVGLELSLHKKLGNETRGPMTHEWREGWIRENLQRTETADGRGTSLEYGGKDGQRNAVGKATTNRKYLMILLVGPESYSILLYSEFIGFRSFRLSRETL